LWTHLYDYWEFSTTALDRVEYDRLIDAGVFQPSGPIELLGGLLVIAEPQGDEHFTAVLVRGRLAAR